MKTKNLLLTFLTANILLLSSMATAGIGGASGGGTTQNNKEEEIQYMTVDQCTNNDIEQICRRVRIKIKPAKNKETSVECLILSGDAGTVPCPKEVGAPKWLKNLNQFFLDQGTRTPEESNSYINP